jgi:hypothetical protein
MSSDNSFKRLERMAYTSYHQDGLLDLFLSWVAFGFGMNIALDSFVWNMLSWLPIIFYIPIKNRITVPRLGYVDFGGTPSGRNRRLTGLMFLGVLVLMVFVIFALPIAGLAGSPTGDWIRSSPLLFFGLLGALGFAAAGAITGIQRLFGYALLCAALLAAGHMLGLSLYVPILLFAAALLTVGMSLMVRFLRRYPSAEARQNDETN